MRKFLLALLIAVPAAAQHTSGGGFPPVACSSNLVRQTYSDTTNNLSYKCTNISGTYIWQLTESPIFPVVSAPTGSCTNGTPDEQVVSTGVLYSCQSGTWGAVGPGGSGTVNSGTTGQIAYYAGNGTAVSGTSQVIDTGDKLIVGSGSGNNTTTGTWNTILGNNAGVAITAPASGANPQGDSLFGYQACPAVTTAREMTCIGAKAGSVFTGNGLGVEDGLATFVGSNAGFSLLGTLGTDTDDVFIGQKAGENMTHAAECVVVGTHGADNIQTCTNSTFLGDWVDSGAAASTMTSSSDVMIGYFAGPHTNGTGTHSNNVMIGVNAGENTVSPINSVIMGVNAASLGTGGNLTEAVIIGFDAGQNITNPAANTLVGAYAGQAINSSAANYSTALGWGALHALQSAPSNTGIGNGSLYNTTSGTGKNTGLGDNSCIAVTTGSQNTCLGAFANVSSGTDTNEIVIGQTVSGKGSNTTSIGNSSTVATFLYGIKVTPTQTAIASATTITPTAQVFHVTGTTAIATITAPTACTQTGWSCQITIIPDGLFTTTTGGNIALASTAVVSKALIMTYDPATVKWYPSY